MAEETMGDVVEALKAGVRRADDNPTMRLSILRHTISNAIDALSRPAPSEASGDVVAAEKLQHLLDRDRYIVAIALGHIKKALNAHRWLLEGRGPYEWDDDRYRDEFTAWVQDVEASTGLLAKLAWDKHDCETDAEKVAAAREAARVYAVDPPVGHRTMLPSDLGLPCPSCAALTPAPQADALLRECREYVARKAEDAFDNREDLLLARIDAALTESQTDAD